MNEKDDGVFFFSSKRRKKKHNKKNAQKEGAYLFFHISIFGMKRSSCLLLSTFLQR